MKTYRYAVLGAGKQGVAAAYDLATRGNAQYVVIADKDVRAANRAAEMVNSLAGNGRIIAIPRICNAADMESVRAILKETDGIVSAMHFTFNLSLTRLAIELGAHMVDMGGNTSVVRKQQRLCRRAAKSGVTIVPDCGMAPGFDVNLARLAASMVYTPHHVQIYCGGIPAQPKNPPLNYAFPFSVGGLVNECSGFADIIRGGAIAKQACLKTIAHVDYPPLGILEATHTSGGLSTAPWTFSKMFPTLETLEYMTLRYPGHWDILRDFASAGKLKVELERIAGETPPDTSDLGIIRVLCSGKDTQGRNVCSSVDVFDTHDSKTGFTAMQRLTGFHASIVLIAAVAQKLPHGVVSVESVNPALVVSQFRARGILTHDRLSIA